MSEFSNQIGTTLDRLQAFGKKNECFQDTDGKCPQSGTERQSETDQTVSAIRLLSSTTDEGGEIMVSSEMHYQNGHLFALWRQDSSSATEVERS